MRNLNTLANTIRLDSIASGWKPVMLHQWATSGVRVPADLALISSEICEAYAEIRKDSYGTHLAAAFADIQIRTLSLAGGLTTDFAFYANMSGPSGICDQHTTSVVFLALHQLVNGALEAFRRDNKDRCLVALGQLYRVVYSVAGTFNIDLDDAIVQKMEVNRLCMRGPGAKRI